MKPAFLEPPGKTRRAGGERMRKTIFILFSSAMLFLSPNLVLSDCMDIGGPPFTSFYIQGGHTIIFYRDSWPIAYLDVPYCTLYPSSSVRLIRNYVCDGDKIIVDNEACTIMNVYSSATRSF
jgi:hypothetical protein